LNLRTTGLWRYRILLSYPERLPSSQGSHHDKHGNGGE
jgi:hypothetical protein